MTEYIILGISALLFIGSIIFFTFSRKKTGVFVKKNIRYTKDSEVKDADGSNNITLNIGDILLKTGNVYVVEKGKDLLPGKYTILSTNSSTDMFNVKINDYVVKYQHATEIVLANGSQIIAISNDIVLR